MGEDDCNVSLSLGIGNGNNFLPHRICRDKKHPCGFKILLQSTETSAKEMERSPAAGEESGEDLSETQRSSRKVKIPYTDEDSIMNTDGGASCRKKLRLTKEQSTLLEDKFRFHNSLTPGQKEDLARQLNLQPRQVEVWFQNRRARTKLKQTEIDRDFLKKCYESLADENLRLKEELMEMRLTKPGGVTKWCIQLQKAARLSICSYCQKMGSVNGKSSSNDLKIISNDQLKLCESTVTEGSFIMSS